MDTTDDPLGLCRAVADLEGVDVDREMVRMRAHQALFEEVVPVRVGRFVVMRRVGFGGMGIVYAAYDPVLDRKVAVKVLRPTDDVDDRERRLLREARALAKLSHPHVVAVHDVGTVGEGGTAAVFIAMEFIEGATLRGWTEREAPAWRTRLDVLVQSARGLAAAHAAGIVHRDFKPDNVMVAFDEARKGWHACVMDFGLARRSPGAPRTDLDTGTSAAIDVPVTRDGLVGGTPGYMPPEQAEGAPTDARTDQYAFCVTAWEALYDVRPFTRAAQPHAPTATAVPTWVQRVLLRGLSRDPDARFADMHALIAALVDDPTRRRRRRAAAIVAIGAVATALGGTAWARARAHEDCRALGSEIDDVWNEGVRDHVRAAILAPDLDYGAETWTRVEVRLDAYAARWSELRASNCSARLTGERSSELSERSEGCFAEHRIELRATLAVLASGDPPTVLDAVATVLALPDVEHCDDEARLARRRPTVGDPELRRELDDLRAQLARANRLPESQSAEAVAAAESVLARAVELDSAEMRLEAERALALASGNGGDFARSAEASRRAFGLAIESGDDDAATRIAASLLFTEGYLLGRYEQAATWAELGVALLARTDPSGGLPTAQLANSRGATARMQGRYEDARRDFAEASSIRERVLGLDHPLTLESVGNAGVLQLDTGDLAGAEATFRTVVEARTRLQGPAHPDVARTMVLHAAALATLGRSDEAIAMLYRALAIEERALGSTSPRLWATLHNLGLLQTRLGDAAGARATHERELMVAERVPSAEPGRLGKTLVALAMADLALDDPDRAMASLVRARSLIESATGADHPELAMCYEEIAAVHERLGELPEAAASYRRSLEIRAASQEPFHPDAALVRSYLGDVQLDLGDTDAALTTLQTSMLHMLGSVGPEHHNTALTLASLGRLYHRRGELATALELLRSAVALEERVDAPDREIAWAHHHVGRLLLDMGELDAALHEHETAVAIAKQEETVDPFTIAPLEVALAEAEAAVDRLADAEDHARSALTQLQDAHIDPVVVAEARFVLGEILRARGHGSEARVHLDRACEVERPPYALRLRRCPPRLRTAW